MRKNISITDDNIVKVLESQQNQSKFIELCINYYIEHNKKQYATIKQLEEIRKEVQILNQNYLGTKDVLEKVAKYIGEGM